MQRRMVSVWVFALGMCAAPLYGQVINTVAGTNWFFPTSSVQALNAPLGTTSGVAVDAQGNVYAADSGNNIVVRISPNGVLTVVAGNGNAGFSGDGGPATSASLFNPAGVAVDSAGNLYVADYGNHRIRKVSGGTITTVAGSGGYGGPYGVAVDSAGNIYIGDDFFILKVSGGTITTVAGDINAGSLGDGGPATSAQVYRPTGLCIDSAGNLYFADAAYHRVRKVSGGTITTVAGNGNSGFSGDGGPATDTSLTTPIALFDEVPTFAGVAADSAGNLYFADAGNHRIRKVYEGTISTVAGNGAYRFSGDGGLATGASLQQPTGVAVDSAGNLYFADQLNNRIRRVSGGTITTVAGNGNQGFSGDGGPATSASISLPFGVAVDSAGNLYFAGNNRIRKVSGGAITTVVGNGDYGFSGDGGPATGASLWTPQGLAVDSVGNLYFADSGNWRIRKVSGGTITTVAGVGSGVFSGDGGPATSATLQFPEAVTVDAAGNLYIADRNNNRIRKVSGGTITTVAGNGNQGLSGDGGPATSATLNNPSAVAVDSAGNLYFPDLNRIRKVSSGTITTVAGNGNQGFSGDGGPATSSSLYGPSGMTADPAGNLYIADTGNNRIREVFARSVSYQATPASLSFSTSARASATGTQTINLSSSVAGLTFTASTSAAWLSVSPSSGSMPAILTVSIDPSSLAAGTYQGTVTITAPNAVPSTTTVAVTLTVKPGTPAALGIDTQNVSFTATQGSGPLTQQLHVLNPGGGSLSFTANASTTSGGSWLSISPANGTATPSSPASLTITATPGSIAPGTYSGTITVIGAGSTVNVAVTLSVSAPTSIILVSQSGLSFTSVAQGGVPLPQNFGIDRKSTRLNSCRANISYAG